MKRQHLIIIILFTFQVVNGQNLVSERDVVTQSFGKLVYHKDRQNNLLEGHYNIADQFGNYKDAHFKKGLLDGESKSYKHNGKLLQIFRYKEGKPDGEFVVYFLNGKVNKKGQFVDGQKQGKWQFFDESDGTLIGEENYKDNKKEGKFWRRSYASNKSTYAYNTTFYKNDQKSGHAQTKNQDGVLLWEADYIDDGTYVEKKYYDNAKLAKVRSQKEWKLDGEQLTYTQNGVLLDRTFYTQDQLVKTEVFYESGKPHKVINYKHDLPDGAYIEYNGDGDKIEEGFYKKGYKHGLWKEYNQERNVLSRSLTYENDELNGEYKIYNKANRVKEQGNYKNGKKHGLIKYYNLAGKLVKEEEYDIGKELSVKEYK